MNGNTFSGLQVIEDIVGHNNICIDKSKLRDGQYLVKNVDKDSKWDEPGFCQPFMGFTALQPGQITVYDYNSRCGAEIAVCAHEAFHARMCFRGKSYYGNENLTNRLAEKWLRRHLSGVKLHAAIEMITLSRISYGLN